MPRHDTPETTADDTPGDPTTRKINPPSRIPRPPGEDPLDRLADGPERTRLEEHELEDIDPDAHDTFQTIIRRRWYTQIVIGTVFALSVEYALWQVFGWWALIPALLLLPYIHRKKWTRQTDYGALAAAKLAENPHSERHRDRLDER